MNCGLLGCIVCLGIRLVSDLGGPVFGGLSDSWFISFNRTVSCACAEGRWFNFLTTYIPKQAANETTAIITIIAINVVEEPPLSLLWLITSFMASSKKKRLNKQYWFEIVLLGPNYSYHFLILSSIFSAQKNISSMVCVNM